MPVECGILLSLKNLLIKSIKIALISLLLVMPMTFETILFGTLEFLLDQFILILKHQFGFLKEPTNIEQIHQQDLRRHS